VTTPALTLKTAAPMMRVLVAASMALVVAFALAFGFREDAGVTIDVFVFPTAGFACGFLNTVASSGSAVSLPLMILLGMNPHTANATNRLPVLIGSLTAIFAFHRAGQMDWKTGFKLAPPVVAGSALGALAAEMLPARELGPMISAAVLMAFILLFTKVKKIIDNATAGDIRTDLPVLAVMLGIGFWAGFLVLDSATYMLLALVVLVSYDLLHANAMKNLLLGAATVVAFALFAAKGNIDWANGAMLSIGSIGGSYVGVRVAQFTTAKVWVFRILATVILLELVHVGIQYFLEIY
jgi:uncharacterized membrane protein YfcA